MAEVTNKEDTPSDEEEEDTDCQEVAEAEGSAPNAESLADNAGDDVKLVGSCPP
jgi:hypothetical protein